MKKILSLLLLSIFTIASYAGTISIKDWYGTGFALKEGYVVTNYHVVDGATHVYIKGVGGDFSQEYAATVVEVDKENDLAIVKIEDSKFTSFGNIPYSIQTAAAEIGEDIFVLGYPMTDVMGEEIKLTTGVINSCSGYKGDNRSYQISAPIQPGNSGGPLFNKKGEVIGIVNAKLLGAENAGYAIKAQYLSKYLDTTSNSDFNLNDIRHFFTKRSLSNQSLVEQVKMIKNHVFIVKCCLKPKLYKIEYTTTNNEKLYLGNKKDIARHTFEDKKGTIYLIRPITPSHLVGKGENLKSVVIGTGIKEIGYFAFHNCVNLTSVTIPNSVTSIAGHAFSNCSSLTSITIPESVTSIGEYAFSDCGNPMRINIFNFKSWCNIDFKSVLSFKGYMLYLNNTEVTELTLPSGITKIKPYSFSFCNSLTSIIIPDSVTSIEDYAFWHCGNLTNVTISHHVTSIGRYAFDGCTNLIDVMLSNSITSIKRCTFRGCIHLKNITIPNSVTSIEDEAFNGCTSLTSITIPNNVISIGNYAFNDCTSLKEVYCKPTTPPAGGYAMFYNNASGRIVFVPQDSIETYRSTMYWQGPAVQPYDFKTYNK